MKKLITIVNKKVRQSNHFVESPYAQEFSAHEIKIFELACAGCKASDIELYKKENNKKYIYSAKDLAKLLNTTSSVISQEADRISSSIMKKYITFKNVLSDGTIEFEKIAIMPYAKYKNGILEFHINYKVLPYFININGSFTEFSLKYLLAMNSPFAIKLYKLLYQYKNMSHTRKFTVEQLKEQFGIPNKYKEYKDFKKRIIDPSVTKINKFTDLNIEYQELRVGRRVEEIKFSFDIIKSLEPSIIIDKLQIEDKKETSNSWDNFVNFYYKSYGQIKSYQRINEFNKLSQDKIIKIYKNNKFEAVVLARYVLDKAKQDVNSYLIRHGVNGVSYINQKDVEKIKNKIECKSTEEKVKIKQKEDENKEHKEKNDIKHEFYKLVDSEKDKYIKHAELLCKKYKLDLVFKNKNNEDIAFSVYSVSNNKKYSYPFEKYCKENNINLNIYK